MAQFEAETVVHYERSEASTGLNRALVRDVPTEFVTHASLDFEAPYSKSHFKLAYLDDGGIEQYLQWCADNEVAPFREDSFYSTRGYLAELKLDSQLMIRTDALAPSLRENIENQFSNHNIPGHVTRARMDRNDQFQVFRDSQLPKILASTSPKSADIGFGSRIGSYSDIDNGALMKLGSSYSIEGWTKKPYLNRVESPTVSGATLVVGPNFPAEKGVPLLAYFMKAGEQVGMKPRKDLKLDFRGGGRFNN